MQIVFTDSSLNMKPANSRMMNVMSANMVRMIKVDVKGYLMGVDLMSLY